MPKYVIERELPGAGKLTQQELHGIAQKSCSVRGHAKKDGFPANRVSAVRTMIDPATAE